MTKFYKKILPKKTSFFSLFLLISLLLHLLVGLLLQTQLITPEKKNRPERTAVALQERNNWLELDHKPREKTAEPPQKTTHIAEDNAKVEQETAPKGDESRDQPKIAKQQRQITQQSSVPEPQQKQSIRHTPSTSPTPPPSPVQADKQGERNLPTEPELVKQLEPVEVSLPSLNQLTNLSPTTLARMDRQEQQQRSKDRPEIALKDDEVWLNLRQDDKLISFFRRFSDRIEAVWNYPTEASSQGVEGTLLIKIIVNKKGELIDAFPLESSGSKILDYEAITAVYRAAPFGELPRYYPHDQLKIFAHFQYNLSRRMIYGNPR